MRLNDLAARKAEGRPWAMLTCYDYTTAKLEEAAGITKFKARKAEAERRMENTSQNLERVEDILSEVGAKLPQL